MLKMPASGKRMNGNLVSSTLYHISWCDGSDIFFFFTFFLNQNPEIEVIYRLYSVLFCIFVITGNFHHKLYFVLLFHFRRKKKRKGY